MGKGKRFTDLVDIDGLDTGNRRKNKHIEDRESFFGELFEYEDYCPRCDYEGQLKSTKHGWRCPKCRTVVIPHGEDG